MPFVTIRDCQTFNNMWHPLPLPLLSSLWCHLSLWEIVKLSMACDILFLPLFPSLSCLLFRTRQHESLTFGDQDCFFLPSSRMIVCVGENHGKTHSPRHSKNMNLWFSRPRQCDKYCLITKDYQFIIYLLLFDFVQYTRWSISSF